MPYLKIEKSTGKEKEKAVEFKDCRRHEAEYEKVAEAGSGRTGKNNISYS